MTVVEEIGETEAGGVTAGSIPVLEVGLPLFFALMISGVATRRAAPAN